MSSSGGRRSCGIGCLVLPAVLVPLAGSYYTVANRIPLAPHFSAKMPSENARDVYLAAAPYLPKDLPLLPSELDRLSELDSEKLVISGKTALTRLDQGLSLPYADSSLRSVLDGSYEDLKALRGLASLIQVEGRLEERRGRIAEATRAYLRVLRMAAQISHGPAEADSLLANRIRMSALRDVERVIPRTNGPVAQEALRALMRIDEAAATTEEELQNHEITEANEVVECMRITHSGSEEERRMMGNTPPWILGFDLTYNLTSKEKMLNSFRRYCQALRVAMREPYWKRRRVPPPPKDPVNAWFTILQEDSLLRFDLAEAYFQLVQVKLAAHAYRMRIGRPVSDLRELVPLYVESVVDPFSGNLLQYRQARDKGAPTIYSLGPDMNDDGGAAIESYVTRDSDGDLPRVPLR